MAEKKSIAAQAGTLAVPTLTMPAVFGEPSAPMVARSWPPYVVFAHPNRGDEWNKIRAKYPSVAEGDIVFVNGDEVLKLDVAKMSLVCATQFWCETNGAGEIQRVRYQEQPWPWQERAEAVCLLYVPDRVVPVNVQFRTTKCGACKTLSDALKLASTPQWGEQSATHLASMQAPQPFMRFYGEVVSQTPRVGKKSGRPYRPAVATIKPTSVDEWTLLKKLSENPETQKALDVAAQRYQSQLEEFKKKSAA